VEVCDRDDDLIHAGEPKEDWELCLHLVRLHHVVVGWGDLLPLVLLLVRHIFIFSMHGSTQLPSVLIVPTKVAARGGGVTSAADLKFTKDPP
jgi:hypothetical protein